MAQPPPHPTSLRSPSTADRQYHGCSRIQDYEVLTKLGEGTFGEVHKARSRQRGSLVALKKILMHNEKEGFPITALREIKLLKMLDHINVLRLEEMAIERDKRAGRTKAAIYMVTPYMDHDLSGLLENPDVRFTEPQIKCYMLQLLEGIRYLHDSHILHRDMKAANLLINNKGILQIADFGLARHYDEPVPKAGCGNGEARRDYTTLVVTRWYRPPELLLQLRRYTPAIDMWGVGCVFGEMFKSKPILAGTSDLNQAQIIFDLVGSPTEENMPGWSALPGCEGVKTFSTRRGSINQAFSQLSPTALSLLKELLKLDWRKRINAIDALQHPYFHTEPLPARPEDIPTFEESHELDRRKFRDRKAAPPPAPAGGTVGMGANGEWNAAGVNGSYFVNGERGPRGTSQQPADRGPPRGYNDRRPPRDNYHDPRAPAPGAAPHARDNRPAWQRRPDDRDQRSHHELPPRPPIAGQRHHLPDRPPPANGRPGGAGIDTYIPAYGGRDRPPARTSRSPRDERGPRDRRANDSPQPRPRDERDRRFREEERDRRRNGGTSLEVGDRDARRTRSRSPDRGDYPDRSRGRDRDSYRRDERR